MRCDLSITHECSCIPSGVSCKVQAPLDLGTFRGTNHPTTFEILQEANTRAAKDGPALLGVLAIIVFAIIIGLGAQVAPAAI